MSLQEDFHASLSPSQVEERERMITATSGRTCSVLYEKSDPLGLLVKTLLESSQWYSPARRLKWDAKPLFSERITEKEYCYDKNTLSKPSVKTLSEKDTPSNRCLFRLVPSERPTEETGYGLLPTPTVMEDRRKPNGNSNRQKKIMSNLNPYSIQELLPTVQTLGLKMCDKNGKTQFYPMELLPTPTTIDAGSGRINKSNSPNAKERPTIALAARRGLLPTPMASDATTGAIIGKNDQFITTGNGTPRKINQNGTNGSIGLARMVQLLPTPNAREADKYSKKYNPKSQMGTALTAMAVNGMLPTPTARSYKNGSKPEDGRTQRKMEQGWTMELNDLAACNMLPTPTTRDYKNSMSPNGMMRKNGKLRNDVLSNIPVMIGEHCQQRTGKTSQLNPLFFEEMMGFPLMWTTLPFLSQDGDRNQSKDTETP